jgi:hypothetical protein
VAKPTCEIRCEGCGEWFPSPIQFGSGGVFQFVARSLGMQRTAPPVV